MQSLFSPDSKFMQVMSRVADIFLLNLCFLLCCIPIFTIGAATTALYTVCFRMGTEREAGTVKPFFRAFRDNFKQATVIWLIVLLCGVCACFNVMLFYTMKGVIHYLFCLFMVLLILVVMISSYAFPLISQFNNTNKEVLKNALILSIGYLPKTLLIGIFNVFPFVLLATDLIAFFQVGFIWLAFYFSTVAYVNTKLLKGVFAPFMGGDGEEEETETLPETEEQPEALEAPEETEETSENTEEETEE